MLQPKRTKFRKQFKGRNRGLANNGNKVSFGQFGLQAVPVGASADSLYFGLAGTNSLDDAQAMPFLQPSKEALLEYDIAKMISELTRPTRKKVGILTSLEMQAGYDAARQALRDYCAECATFKARMSPEFRDLTWLDFFA